MDELDDLLGEYFDCGVAEGREGRNHDTEDGAAQRTLGQIRDCVRRMVAAERTPQMTMDDIYAAWHGAGVDIAGGNWARFVGMLPGRSNSN